MNTKTENLYKKMNDLNKEKKREEEINNIKKRAQNIIIISVILLLIGLANFYSTILRLENTEILKKVIKHLFILSASVVSFCIGMKINISFLNKNKVRFTFLALGFLIFSIVAFFPNKTLFPTINGGKGWIRIGGSFTLQVTELFKVAYIVIISSLLARGKDNNGKFNFKKDWGSVIVYLFIFLGLLLCLNDLGTGIHYAMITIFLLFLSDIKNKTLTILMSFLSSIVILLGFYIYKFGDGYKQHRLKTYIDGVINNNYDRFEAYQVYQSLIALGTGGIFGKGYGNGVQKYNYIPEVETDFAISTFGEEMGFVGMFLVLLSFFILFILIMNVAENSKSYFEKYLTASIAGYLITQVIINIGVAIGLIPVFGIPLPFISSGGSSLLAVSASIGIVININNSKLKEIENSTLTT